jgi:hypothetical protein
MNSTMQVGQGGDIERVYDAQNRDVLIGRRLEVFFEPSGDGSPSLQGKLIWHTEWEHRMGDVLRGTSLGPRIERTIEQVAAGEFGGVPGMDVIAVVKAAYVAHASEAFGIGASPLGAIPLDGDSQG